MEEENRGRTNKRTNRGEDKGQSTEHTEDIEDRGCRAKNTKEKHRGLRAQGLKSSRALRWLYGGVTLLKRWKNATPPTIWLNMLPKVNVRTLLGSAAPC